MKNLLIALALAVAAPAHAETMADAVGCVDEDDIKVLRGFAIDMAKATQYFRDPGLRARIL